MKLVAIIYILFGIIALGLGIYVLTNNHSLGTISDPWRIGFGVALVVYSIYRIISGVRTFRKPDEHAVSPMEVYKINHQK